MRKAIFAINMTLDGFFGHEGMIADEELHEHFTELMRGAGVILFGRKMYQLLLPYWHTIAEDQSETQAENEFARVIDSVDKIVFFQDAHGRCIGEPTISRANIEEVLQKLKSQPGKDIYIDGLAVAAHLMRLGMIDEFYFAVHPVIAGKGPRLLEDEGLRERLQLELVGSKSFRSGTMALHYKKRP